MNVSPDMPTDVAAHARESAPRRSFSIFQEPWWLDVVAPGNWHEVSVVSGSEIVGRLPYVLKRRRGLTYLKMPLLSQFLGPWIDPGDGKYVTRLANEHKILQQLLVQLPAFDAFDQALAPEITNWLPFYWAEFEATVRYTYRIDGLADLDTVWQQMRENIRREIRKAEKRLRVTSKDDVPSFLATYDKTFRRQGMKQPFDNEFVDRVVSACLSRNAGKILFAEDAQDRIHAAVFFAWNDDVCYYLMSGADQDLRNSGATSLLVWEGIKMASGISRTFDFEGSMIPGVERFMRSFGAHQTPYFTVQKFSRRMQVAKSLKTAWMALRGRA